MKEKEDIISMDNGCVLHGARGSGARAVDAGSEEEV